VTATREICFRRSCTNGIGEKCFDKKSFRYALLEKQIDRSAAAHRLGQVHTSVGRSTGVFIPVALCQGRFLPQVKLFIDRILQFIGCLYNALLEVCQSGNECACPQIMSTVIFLILLQEQV
jgi:hypothetical protein